jgi:hypothetical protein
MKRLVEPELLDDLPHDDPMAIGSRGDIARLNRIMDNGRILKDLLQRGAGKRAPRRVVELGAGDGSLMLELARQLSGEWKGVELALVDQKSAVSAETRAGFMSLGWELETAVADVFDWLEKSEARANVMVANLFLHHFEEKELARLLALAAARTDVLAVCEPRRGILPLAFSRTVGLLGCNAVTQHDAVASVRAGFAGSELSALWPAKREWRLREGRSGLFTHAFLAERNSAT